MFALLFALALFVILLGITLSYNYLRIWRLRPLLHFMQQQGAAPLPFVPPAAGIASTSIAQRIAPPTISIVVASDNDDWWMERLLPQLLTQDAPFVFEVVVADASDAEDETRNIVQRLQQEHAHLRYTFVPPSHRNVFPRKLALTLGVRAARAPWVVVVAPNSMPHSSQWLQRIMQQCTEAANVVVGSVQLTADFLPPCDNLCHNEWQANNFLRWLQHRSAASDATNVAFRKSWASAQGLFTESLNLPYGECALLSARADADTVGLALHPDAAVQQTLPEDPMALAAQRRTHRQLQARLAQMGIRPMRPHHVARALWGCGIVLFVLAAAFRVLQSCPDANAAWHKFGFPLTLVAYDWSQVIFDVVPTLLFLWLLCSPLCARHHARHLFDNTLAED